MNKIFVGSQKTGKQCRQRYHNSLASCIVKKQWTKQEEQKLFILHDQLGNKWTEIAHKLPGRAHNCVKNRFYAELRKSLRKFNRYQKKLRLNNVKLVKVEGIIKILALGYKNFDQEQYYKLMGSKCIDIKHQLRSFHSENPISNDFQNKICNLFKSISSLVSIFKKSQNTNTKFPVRKSKFFEELKKEQLSQEKIQQDQEKLSNNQNCQEIIQKKDSSAKEESFSLPNEVSNCEVSMKEEKRKKNYETVQINNRSSVHHSYSFPDRYQYGYSFPNPSGYNYNFQATSYHPYEYYPSFDFSNYYYPPLFKESVCKCEQQNELKEVKSEKE